MEVKILSEKHNPLLKRTEIHFRVEPEEPGSTPPRLEIRKTLAAALKKEVDVVFIKKFETKTGTRTVFGVANVYDSAEEAKLVEPEYVIKRNSPPEKPKEEEK